jgi:hypothetical protein
MNPLEYLRLQLRLEGKEIIHGQVLRQVEFVPDEGMPLMVIAQLADSNLVAYFDEGRQIEFREDLRKQVSEVSFPKVDQLCAFLQTRYITFEVGHYKTHSFPERYGSFVDTSVRRFSKQDPKVQAFGFDGFAEQVYGIERDGKIVSACVSTRENDFCGEAWVYTDQEYRHQGLAPKVVGAWATGLLSAGKVPFYSHKIQNDASANLAKRLGLQPVFEEIVISYGSQ